MNDKAGIIVFGHTRVRHLENLLESLRRQDAGNDVHVWLDGHHGRQSLADSVYACRNLVMQEFPEVRLQAMEGNIGIEKLTLDGLSFMIERYARIIVLEDDGFPTSDAIFEFEKALDDIENRPEVYSVYGHHFLVPAEGKTITRFQGWGWATTREKLKPVLAEMRRCFVLPEVEYRAFARNGLSTKVIGRLDVTPGRNCVPVIGAHFCWDGCTCLLTAMQDLVHQKTAKRVIYNCGMDEAGSHFVADGRYTQPPFNMVSVDVVWQYFSSDEVIKRGYGGSEVCQ